MDIKRFFWGNDGMYESKNGTWMHVAAHEAALSRSADANEPGPHASFSTTEVTIAGAGTSYRWVQLAHLQKWIFYARGLARSAIKPPEPESVAKLALHMENAVLRRACIYAQEAILRRDAALVKAGQQYEAQKEQIRELSLRVQSFEDDVPEKLKLEKELADLRSMAQSFTNSLGFRGFQQVGNAKQKLSIADGDTINMTVSSGGTGGAKDATPLRAADYYVPPGNRR